MVNYLWLQGTPLFPDYRALAEINGNFQLKKETICFFVCSWYNMMSLKIIFAIFYRLVIMAQCGFTLPLHLTVWWQIPKKVLKCMV